MPVLDLIQELSPLFNHSYPFCKWRNVVSTCEKYFTKTFTEDGLCYTFNGLDASELYRNITYVSRYITLYKSLICNVIFVIFL